MSELKIQAICGFGVGSSTLLKIKIQGVLKEMGVEAEVFTGDVSSASGVLCDVIFTSNELAENLKSRAKVPVIVINNFVNSAEIKEKVEEFLKTR
ncbi:MAG: PTS sugar transporter subunit IIB [Defluviitaleaceae bacterium]|nr:PTS sugar transporter subunit IIB [Defluviitaleaceae bacterium]